MKFGPVLVGGRSFQAGRSSGIAPSSAERELAWQPPNEAAQRPRIASATMTLGLTSIGAISSPIRRSLLDQVMAGEHDFRRAARHRIFNKGEGGRRRA
jgi:hypothetical protein